MTGNGGLNKAIHIAAGYNLQKACEKPGNCEVGEAKATDAYNLPCKYIIHTVGPVWQDGKHNLERTAQILVSECAGDSKGTPFQDNRIIICINR